jgi:hypothetical protein
VQVNSAVIIKNQQTGEFEASVELVEGANLIEAVAKSAYGNIQTVNKIVQYQNESSVTDETKKEINPLYFLAGALIIVMLFLILVTKLSKRR